MLSIWFFVVVEFLLVVIVEVLIIFVILIIIVVGDIGLVFILKFSKNSIIVGLEDLFVVFFVVLV